MNVEIIGIVAAVFALTGFLFSKEVPLRLLSSVAAILFTVYGLFIGSPSIWVLNLIIFCIHMYKLYRIRCKRQGRKSF